MCYMVYTNFQRQGAVANLTAGEVLCADSTRDYRVISVWDHKTASSHGPAKIAVSVRIYKLLLDYMGTKQNSDLVFFTTAGEKVTHISLELEKLGEAFGKKFTITPTLNRKQMATSIAKIGSDKDERSTASHMTHSLEVHRSSYQHNNGAEQAVDRYRK